MNNILAVTKPLDESMVKYINSLPDGTIIEFKNTVGINPELMRNIKEGIKIRIIGGLDEKAKPKYNDREYFERTLYSPSEVYKIIKTMEYIEAKIDPNWSDLEKAMYIYKVMCENMKYAHQRLVINGRDYCRNLLGFITKKAVCAGFGMMYKEMMDRQGIECHYQNRQHGHAWNVIKINGRYIPVDLTWDNTLNEGQGNRCDFAYFGRDKDFYKNLNHQVTDEQKLMTGLLSEAEFTNAYLKITGKNKLRNQMSETINSRGEKLYYIKIKEGNYTRCYIVKNGEVKTVLFDNSVDMKTILDSNIFEFDTDVFQFTTNGMELLNMQKANENIKKFKREDGSTFFLITDGKAVNGVIPHICMYFEKTQYGMVANGDNILSDDNLVRTPNVYSYGIANILLSKDRLAKKISRFNGYVGYIGMEKGKYIKYVNAELEEKLAGVHRF